MLKILNQGIEIAEGITNSVIGIEPNSEFELIVKSRETICNACEHKGISPMGFENCNLCGCFLHLKQRSKESKCPIQKW